MHVRPARPCRAGRGGAEDGRADAGGGGAVALLPLAIGDDGQVAGQVAKRVFVAPERKTGSCAMRSTDLGRSRSAIGAPAVGADRGAVSNLPLNFR